MPTMIDVEGATPDFAAHETQPSKSQQQLFSTYKDLQYMCLAAIFVCILSYYICTYFWPWFESVHGYYSAQKRILKRLADNAKRALEEQEELQAMLQQYKASPKYTPNKETSLQPDFKLSVPNPAPVLKPLEVVDEKPTQGDACTPAYTLKRFPNRAKRNHVPVPTASSSASVPTQSAPAPEHGSVVRSSFTSLASDTNATSAAHRNRELIAQQDAEFEKCAAIDRMKMNCRAHTTVHQQSMFSEYHLKEEPEVSKYFV